MLLSSMALLAPNIQGRDKVSAHEQYRWPALVDDHTIPTFGSSGEKEFFFVVVSSAGISNSSMYFPCRNGLIDEETPPQTVQL